ncbi:carbohydrate sulfotransferase 4-like isoform X2 [Penaeus japonicus]|nr:carbohydrate sulfotransferase 4-like isoform X2 [Penaeus japonicus]
MKKLTSTWSLLALLMVLMTLVAFRSISQRQWKRSDILLGPSTSQAPGLEEVDKDEDDQLDVDAAGEDDDYWDRTESDEDKVLRTEEGDGRTIKIRTEEEKVQKVADRVEGEEAQRENTQPQEKKKQKVIVLWTSWRSGSTFLGELLKRASTKTFYSYEPLHIFKIRIYDKPRDDSPPPPPVFALRDILSCNFEAHRNLVSYQSNKIWYLRANTYFKKTCKRSKKTGKIPSCSDPHYVSENCRSASVHLIKVLRLSLRWARTFLEDKNLDFHIMYLARDPRAVHSSRQRVGWCRSPSCRDPNVTCSILDDDLAEAAVLRREFPDRFRFLHYDQICQNMTTHLESIMAFLELPVQPEQKALLKAEKSSRDQYSVHKNSLLQAQLWRSRTSFEEIVLPVQQACQSALKKLGLRTFPTEKEFKDLSVPALERPAEL